MRIGFCVGVLILLTIGILAGSFVLRPKAIVASVVSGSGVNPSVVERLVVESSPSESFLDALGYGAKGKFNATADSALGKWSMNAEYQPASWAPSARVKVMITLSFSQRLVDTAKQTVAKIDQVCILLTAERDFDPSGLQRAPHDEQVSTLLSPAGLPIEGGGSSAVSRFNGYTERTPVDIMLEAPMAAFKETDSPLGWWSGTVSANFDLPKDLPPGIYRLRLDFGFRSAQRRLNFNGDGMGQRPRELKDVSCAYSPPIPASGSDVTGRDIDAAKIRRRCYWVLLWDYNSNGYRGVVALEDQDRVGISPGISFMMKSYSQDST